MVIEAKCAAEVPCPLLGCAAARSPSTYTAATIAPRMSKVTRVRFRVLSFSPSLLGDGTVGACPAVPRTAAFGTSNGI
jgi:hypothetical protein